MKNKVLSGFAALGALILMCSAGAAGYPTTPSVQAQIPFDFVVGQTTLKAGDYTISRITPSVVSIRAVDGTTVTVIAIRYESRLNTKGTTLTFNRYGNQSFLARISSQDQSMRLDLTKSQQERSLIQQVKDNRLVSMVTVP